MITLRIPIPSSMIGWVRIILIGGFKYAPRRRKFAFHFSSDHATTLSPPPVRRKACKHAPCLHHSSCCQRPDAHQYHWKATRVQSAPERYDALSVSTGADFQVLQKEMHVTFPAGTWSTRGECSSTVVCSGIVKRRETVASQTELEGSPTHCYWWEWACGVPHLCL